MKIEIELEEIETLRAQVKRLKDDNKSLQDELKQLNKEELREKANALSFALFNAYMEMVFRKLGFDEQWDTSVRFDSNMEHWLGKDWYNKDDRLKINFGGNISKQWKTAFLDIGIITPKDPEYDPLEM